ncbi:MULTISPECIES: helix-hairpin-helix domain-containing protein [unclassified Natrinema]|uniref:helix-hairpin-helix domain-containing protein n=1 Tax=unclassified Natrinema TaxID=2622230 RepID=UPI000B1C428F|nr:MULTISPECIES: helix-hairpin-helix domain-containing protein [unclassified Natrinema]
MARSDSPIRTLFDAQRTAVKQSQQLLKQGMTAQRTVDTMVGTGLTGQESLQRYQLEVAQAATHGTLSAMAAMLPGDDATEAHQAVDESFEQLKRTHAAVYDMLERDLEQGVDATDELDAAFVDALDDQTDQLLEMTEAVEDRTVETVDELTGHLHEQLEQTRELQDRLEEQLERQTDDVEALLERQAEGIEQFQQQLTEQAEAVTREIPIQGTDESHTAIETDPEHTLESVAGIDAETRDKLSAAGIATVDDLIRAGPEAVAEAADISETRAEDWIEQAKA